MEWIERLNETMAYIEAHLEDEIDYSQLAKVAYCSEYHFQRMFAYMAQMPLSEYIRRRRMSRAAVELAGGAKIIDVALKYGYASPTAFNRAFQSVLSVAPSAVKSGENLKSFPPLCFKMTVKGVEEMNYRVEKKEAFRVVGISAPLSDKMEENFAFVPGMWNKAMTDGTINKLVPLMNAEPKGVLGLSACGDGEKWRYYIGVASSAPSEDFEEMTIGANTWAIFPGEGKGITVQSLEQRIFTEWLPTSGYEYANAPDIEVYIDPNPENTRFEVWIPIVKKV